MTDPRLSIPNGKLGATESSSRAAFTDYTLPLCNSALVTPGNSQLLSLPWEVITLASSLPGWLSEQTHVASCTWVEGRPC